jgi:hypothetical protein
LKWFEDLHGGISQRTGGKRIIYQHRLQYIRKDWIKKSETARSAQQKPHVPAIRTQEKRMPDDTKFNGRLRNGFSRADMPFPIHRIGWGKNRGSPRIRSRINAIAIISQDSIGIFISQKHERQCKNQ